MVTRWMAAGAPMKGSELMAAMPSPREKATARHGSWNLKLNRSLPVSRSHSFADESPEPVSSLLESPAQVAPIVGEGDEEQALSAIANCLHSLTFAMKRGLERSTPRPSRTAYLVQAVASIMGEC